MDKSEEYTKMCICPEVQKQWKLPHDDQDYIYHYRTGFWLNGNQVRPGDRDAGWVADEKVGFMNGQLIWLPRQDQIQEMYSKIVPQVQLSQINQVVNPDPFISVAKEQGQSVGEYEKFKAESLGRREYFRGYYSQFQTWEQLWLAFYMSEKHQKIWNGKKWTKSE